jgi:hypothetical protein
MGGDFNGRHGASYVPVQASLQIMVKQIKDIQGMLIEQNKTLVKVNEATTSVLKELVHAVEQQSAQKSESSASGGTADKIVTTMTAMETAMSQMVVNLEKLR